MRILVAAALLAACSSQPAPTGPAPLPPEAGDGSRRAGPAPRQAAPEEAIAVPGEQQPRAQGGTATALDGARVDLATTWADSNVVVVFYRGSWCKICRKRLTELQAAYTDILHTGAHLYAISTDDVAAGKQLAADLGLGYPLLSDPQGTLIRAWGVLDESTGIAKVATFLVARGGAVVRQYVGQTPSDQPDSYQLLQWVKQMSGAETPE